MPASAGKNNLQNSSEPRNSSASAEPHRISPQAIEEQFRNASMILRQALGSWQMMTTVSPMQVGGATNQLDTLRDLRMAFAEITRMCVFLRSRQSDESARGGGNAAQYCELLAKFRLQLPRIQGWLMVERSRLASRHTHSASVRDWIETTRQTR
jgi:hypothetical protein